MKNLLIAISCFVLATTAHAYEPVPISDGYVTHYLGTPVYPENYDMGTDIFQKIYVDAYDLDYSYRTVYIDHFINHSVIGATFYYKGQKVGEVQNVENTPNLLFTDVDLFVTEPASALVYRLVIDYPIPGREYCSVTTCHWEPSIEQIMPAVPDVSFEYWNATTNPIPEPETYAMMLSGLGLLGFVARRKKVANSGRTLALAA